jgi:GNAT superfamily N-acetyltransferase
LCASFERRPLRQPGGFAAARPPPRPPPNTESPPPWRPADPSLLPKGQPSRLVGTARLDFDLSEAASRDASLSRLEDLPPGSSYLSNMAVDPKLRRMGVARALLAACDAAVAEAAAAAAAARGGEGGGGGGEAGGGGGETGGAGAAAGRAGLYLHVAEADAGARALYAGFGYEAVRREAPGGGGGGGGLLGLLAPGGGGGGGGWRARVLMRRGGAAAGA